MVQTRAAAAAHDTLAGSLQRIPEEVRMHNI